MKQAEYNKNGKQIINTGFKKFDNATNCICTGNVITNTQFGLYIRPYKQKFCNGIFYDEGYLMNSDLKGFKNISKYILDIIKDKNREDSIILYQFDVDGDIIGHILCDFSDHYIAHDCVMTKYSKKRSQCIINLIDYVSYPNTTEIPDYVKQNFIEQIKQNKKENITTLYCYYGNRKYVLHYSCIDSAYSEFPVPAYKKYNPMYVAVYEISSEISKFTYKPREIHIDNVNVNWF